MPDESASTPDKQPSPADKKPASGGTPGDATDKSSSPRDYELLGDLHLKQGQSKDALKAYQKAAEKSSDPKHAAAMYLKMAQIYLTAENNKTEMDIVLEKAREFVAKAQEGPAKKETPKATKPASPLPARLIITASKELLDRAGSGRISLEEFKKAATVEYLPFSQDTSPKR
jgi:tetratricopeptide (TPR) repeat protein